MLEPDPRQSQDAGPYPAFQRSPVFHEVGRNQHPIGPQHPVDLPQHPLRIRDDVQGVGDQHRVKGIVPIGQGHGVGYLEGEVVGAIALLRLGDHAVGIVGSDHPL